MPSNMPTGVQSRSGRHSGDGARINAVCAGVHDAPGLREPTGDRESDEKTAISARELPGRPDSPTKIAEAVAWQCSDAASPITALTTAFDEPLTAT